MIKPGQVSAHFQHQDRQCQHQANPESEGHVPEFFRRPVIQTHLLGLQSHSTDGAVPRPLLANLRMHGAGIHGARRHRLARLILLAEILLRVRLEL